MTERRCPTCGASGEARVFADQHLDLGGLDENAFASRKRPEHMWLRLLECPVCDLVYASPVPSQEALAGLYETAAKALHVKLVVVKAGASSSGIESAMSSIIAMKPAALIVIGLNLSDLGTNLFWHGLGGWKLDSNDLKPAEYDVTRGSSSVISVVYEVTFDGLLPEASATVSSAAETFRSVDITCAPWRANMSAHPRPIPLPPPVTKATLPASRVMPTFPAVARTQ